jgi:cytochrome c oxidase subunit 4
MAHAHSTHSHGTASAHSVEDIKKHRKVYVLVFVSLLVGTVLTVSMYYIHFSSMTVTVTIALFIATVKALLVAGFFMHLISERKAIYSTLAVTLFFFAAMMYLIVWSRGEVPAGSEYTPTKYVPNPIVSITK